MAEWISVEDRLPDGLDTGCSDTVIVWCAVHHLAYYDHVAASWRDAEDVGQLWPDDMTITHWTPLPEPPEVK